jgi:hypothetical protein
MFSAVEIGVSLSKIRLEQQVHVRRVDIAVADYCLLTGQDGKMPRRPRSYPVPPFPERITISFIMSSVVKV